MLDCTLTLTDCTFVGGRVASHQLRVHAQITTGANMVEAVGYFFLHVSVLFLMESLHREQSDRMNVNIMEVESLVEKVNTHFVKQRENNIN